MRIKRTLWICPQCSELKPTRHESVVRHIARKHSSMGEPLSVTTRQTRNQMLALGSLAPIKRPFLSKPKDQGFRHDSSVTVDYKDWILNSSPDLIDKAVMVNLVSMVKETKQNTKIIMNQNFTIIASLSKVLKEILELKQSRNNNIFGDFA
jgi:hypothetical protein